MRKSQRRLSVCSNDVGVTSQMKHSTTCQWNTVVCLQGLIEEHCDNVSRVRNNDVPLVQISPQSLKLVSNETPNDVLVVRCQDISVVRLHDVAQELCSDVSKVSNYNVLSKSQMKYPMKSRWQVSTTSLNYVAMTPYQYVCTVFSICVVMTSN